MLGQRRETPMRAERDQAKDGFMDWVIPQKSEEGALTFDPMTKQLK